jgi:hypothetical protein
VDCGQGVAGSVRRESNGITRAIGAHSRINVRDARDDGILGDGGQSVDLRARGGVVLGEQVVEVRRQFFHPGFSAIEGFLPLAGKAAHGLAAHHQVRKAYDEGRDQEHDEQCRDQCHPLFPIGSHCGSPSQ